MTFVGVDTNVLAYAAGVSRAAGDAAKINAARTLLTSFKAEVTVTVSTQAWGELFAVLTRTGMGRSQARSIINDLRTGIATAPVATDTFDAALDLAETHGFQIWDAIIVKSCQAAGCTLLLSEDMQDGFKVGSLLIANPLAANRHPKLSAVLSAT
jgi:predicted nucleic acid-binding protein